MNPNWSFLKKLGFLFLFIYLIFYINSAQFFFTFLLEPLWQKVIPWFANLVGHEQPISVFSNGSGDTTYNYYQVYFFAVVAIIFASAILIIDRKRENYKTLLHWLLVLVRYYLAMQMIQYGLAKLHYLQFQFPRVERFDQELGDFSPMGLLWTFMGYSKGYTMFTGALEFIGGVLLLSKRTTTLGALTTFGVMLNVMMLNYCYDVPVKILSTHMVLMSIFLIALDGKRLLSFFITNQKVEPYVFPEIVRERHLKIKNIIKWILIIGYLLFSNYQLISMKKQYKLDAPKPYFYGKYVVEDFTRIMDSLDVDKTFVKPDWNTFYQTSEGYATIKLETGKIEYFNFEPDTTQQLFKIKGYEDSKFQEMKYEKLDDSRWRVFGKYRKDSLDLILKKESLNNRELVKRGFHWINEYPFNR